jgi:hypothetical protein
MTMPVSVHKRARICHRRGVRRIAITRSAAANLALEAALADLALELVAVPVTRVELPIPRRWRTR